MFLNLHVARGGIFVLAMLPSGNRTFTFRPGSSPHGMKTLMVSSFLFVRDGPSRLSPSGGGASFERDELSDDSSSDTTPPRAAASFLRNASSGIDIGEQAVSSCIDFRLLDNSLLFIFLTMAVSFCTD